MSWASHCLHQKLTVYLLAIAFCLIGLFSLYTIPVAPFPMVKMPQLNIKFSYPGASADTVQTQVTAKVEAQLQSIPNIQQIMANSQTGVANIDLALDSITPEVLMQTQIKVMQAIASSHLPIAVKQPQISLGAGTSGLITYIVSSTHQNLFQIDNFIQSVLYPKFSALPGVTAMGPDQNAIVRIQLLPEKLAEYQLSAATVSARINALYQSSPLGELYLNQNAYLLHLQGNIQRLSDFGRMVVGYHGRPIRLQDIAKIHFTTRNVVPDYYSSFMGKVSDGISLITTARANPFVIADETGKFVQQLKAKLPYGMHIMPILNIADIMHASFNELAFTVVIASLLVLLIALIFLGHFRTTLIPIATIPVCLLGSLIINHLLGFSLNLLTLLAMVIAVGLVVDDAIVVVENITRHLEQGMSKHEAIIHGTDDIALTIIGITLTLLAVYLPITFCHGAFIVFLKAFAIPLAAAVFISGIVALTLTPVMCVSLVTAGAPNRYQVWFDATLKKVIHAYHILLKATLKRPFIALMTIIILIALSGAHVLKLRHEFFPADPNMMVNITQMGAPQDTVESIRHALQRFKSFYDSDKVKYYNIDIRKDPNTGQLKGRVQLEYKAKYLHQNFALAKAIEAYIQKHHMTGLSARAEHFSNWGDYDLQFYIYGGSDVTRLNQQARRLTKLMQASPMFSMVANTIHHPKKQLSFVINTAKAAQLGIYKTDIQQVLSTYFGGYTLNNNFYIDGLSVPVVVQLGAKDLQQADSLQKLRIKSPITGQYYALDHFVHLKTVAKPIVISSFNNQPAVEIEANIAKGYSLSQAMPLVDTLMNQHMPTLKRQYEGNALEYLQGNTQTMMIIVLGITTIYLLLAILFRSLVDPFIILLTIPFTVVGGALSLSLIGGTVNLYSIIGLITLIGLITKHGVLIVQFANHEVQRGASITEAILTATHHRFRPIIMTTLAMALGALPLVLSDKLMYVARQDLGVVIIGGLLIGTLFSLLIVPLVYSLIKRVERVGAEVKV